MTYDRSDRTLAVISRNWTYSTDPGLDIRANSIVLMNLLIPEGGFGRFYQPPSHVKKYFAENPPPPRPLLFQRVLEGARVPHSPASFLGSLASQFDFPDFGAIHADTAMYLLMSVYHSVFTEDHETDLVLNMFGTWFDGAETTPTPLLKVLHSEAQPRWTALFAAAVKHLEKPAEWMAIFAVRVMDFVRTVMDNAYMTSPNDLSKMALTLVRAGLFQTLDDTISVQFTLSTMPRMYLVSSPLHRP